MGGQAEGLSPKTIRWPRSSSSKKQEMPSSVMIRRTNAQSDSRNWTEYSRVG